MGYRAQPNKSSKYKQGKYTLVNNDKYLGDPTTIFYRSGWELKLYTFLDLNERVLKWNVEGITIPYQIENDGKWTTHRYYPDCYAEVQKLDGTISKTAIEIKPSSETIPPTMPKNVTAKSLETHEYRMKMFLRNINKWKTAKEYCNRKGIDFFILTEKHFEDKNIKIF